MLWANDASGDWDVAANWVNQFNALDHHVPTSADDAQVVYSGITVTHSSSASDVVHSLTVSSSQTTVNVIGGTLSIASASTVSGNLRLSGGTLSVTSPASLTVSGAMTWTGGTINGGGTLTSQGILSLGRSTALDYELLDGVTLDNAGYTNFADRSASAYGLELDDGAVVDNLPGASFTFQTDALISTINVKPGTFKNEGTLTKAGGTATSQISAVFNQTSTGSTIVQSGNLELDGGGEISSSLSTASGNSLSFNTGTYNLGASSTLTGAGTLYVNKGAVVNEGGTYATTNDTLVTAISGGTLDLNGGQAIDMPALYMSGGTLSVTSPASLTVSGAMTWTGGTINGGGTLTSQGILSLGRSTALDYELLDGVTLDNAGYTNFADRSASAYGLELDDGAVVDNLPGASFTFQTDALISTINVKPGTFKNEGTLTKAGGTATSQISAVFNQTSTGSTIVQSGTLQLSGPFANFSAGTLSGGQYIIEGTLQFNNAAITTTAAGITLDGPSSRIIDQSGNNALANLADVAVGGGFTLKNGRNFTTAASLSNTGTLTVGSGSTLTLEGSYDQEGGQTNVLGTLANALAPPDAGSALSFNGVQDYATVSDQPSLRLTNTVTIEFWAKRERFGLDIVLEKGGDWTEGKTDYGVGFNSVNNDMFYFYYAGGWRGTSGVTDLGWHYYAVVATQGAANPQLYIDGAAETVQYSGGSGTIDLNPSTTPLYLGAQIDPVYTYYGKTVLDDVSIWNTALSQSAIQADMNQALTGTVSGLVADWQFNEGSGNITHDQSANHNDATLGGGVAADAPSWVPSGPNGVYIQGGILTGSGTIDANVLNAGLLQANPPEATGILTINGNYTQTSGGALHVNIGGPTAGTQFDSLDVTGQASLDGTLDANLINGYFPPSGASFRVINFGSRSGDFAVETGLFLGGGEGLVPTYDSSGLNLVVIPEQLATTLSLSPSVNPSTYGQSVTFTATVAIAQAFGFAPTGTVTFYVGGSSLGTFSLSGGTSSITTSALVPGSNAIVAIYSGDPNFSGSNSSTLAQIVNQDATATTIAASLNPSVYGQSVTFTATISASAPGSGTPSGTITFRDGSVSLGTVSLNNGIASISTSILAAGTDSITASYGGDADFIASGSPALSQTINQDSVTTTLNTSTANPSVFGQSVTWTALISAASPGGGVPTGTVTFYDGSTELGTTGLSSGSASFSRSTLSVGSHSITATYGGDTNFKSASSTPLSRTVNQDGSVAAVTSSLDPSIFSQSVTFTVVVSASAPGSGTPTGTVALYDGPTAIGTETLSNGSAAFTTSVLGLGNHSITVQYDGDPDFTASTSAAITETIKQASSTAVVSSSVNPSVFGQSVTFTTTVSASPPSSGTPTGTATFYDGSIAIDTETLVNGSASYSTSGLTIGSHTITVRYNGDSSFIASTSPILTQSVSVDGTRTTVISSLDPSIVNQPVNFTATVSASSPGTGRPTGTVTFYDGLAAIDTVALSGGSASFTTATLAVANHSITAVYSGDSDFFSSTSAAFSQVVQQPATAALNGEVYNDLNGDGSLGGGELGLSGWTVQLLNVSNTVVATTTTNSSGLYSFSGVEPGTYTVAPTAPSGYVPTSPASGTLTATAAAGQTIGNLNLGEFQTATFSGELFEDNNQNGLLQASDPGLSGWTVKLLNGSSQAISTATTDGSGNYSFANVTTGTYTITDILQPGYIATTPATGGFSVTPTSGAHVTGNNFGVFKAVSLAVNGLTTAPTSLQSSQNVVVNWSDKNIGTKPVTGSFSDLLTITNTTTGSVLATASVAYDVTSRGNLAAGSSASQQYAFRLPDGNAGVGQVEFTVTADTNDNVSTGQNDPAKTATLVETSTLAPYPDIAVTAVSNPVDAWSGRGIVVTWTVANQGQAVTQGNWNDVIYLKQVNSPGLGQQLGVFPSAENLPPGQTYQRTQDFTLPQGISGSYEIIVTSDANGSVYDSNPANNTGTSAAFPIQLTPSPDLQVTAITVPPTATDFQPVTVSWTVSNNGAGGTNTPSWNDKVYLSRDQTLSADDILIGTARNPSALAPGESYTQSLTATIQGNYDGPYFAIVVTDASQGQREYPFNNDNVTASNSVVEVRTVPSPGFLSASQVSVFPSPPSVIHGGDYLTVNWTVQDTGAGVVSVGNNDVLRTYLGGGVVQDQFGLQTSIHDGVNYTLDYFPPVFGLTIAGSSSSSPGTPGYWIINDRSIGVVNQKVIQDAQFNTQPGLLLPAWIDAIYLSQTPFVQTGAVPIAYQDDYTDPVLHSTLSIGNSYTQLDTIQLPAHMSGTWYVVVVPNIFGTATAAPAQTSDEGSIAIPITATPAPQLQVNAVSAPSTGVSGQSVPVTWTVSNQGFTSTDAGMSQQPGNGSGPPTSSQWTDAIYLSTSMTLVTSGPGAATLLGTFHHAGNLTASQSYTETEQIALPSNIQGKFTIFVEADSTDNIFEASDTYGSPPVPVTGYDPTPINITPPPPADLQVTSIAAPSTAASGLPVSIGWTVTNTGSGTTSTNSWSDQLVLSADDDVTTTNDNIFLGTFTHTGSLGSGNQYTTAGTVTLPVGISGTYYLFVTADTYNAAAGLSGEVNNFASVDLPITLTPSPHLQVTNFQVAGAAFSGQPLPLDWTVTNTGNGPTRPTETSWTDSIYLSANGVLDPTKNVALGSFTHNGGLASGVSYTQSQSVTLPIGISGPYTLFLVVDSLKQVYQAGVIIDSQSLPTSITLSPPPDLEVRNITAPTATYTDQNVTVNWTVTNQGTGPAAPGTWDDSVYLSTDQYLTTTSAVLLGSVQHTGGLANGGTYTASLTARIPDYASGPYYVFVVTDRGNLVFEATPSGSHQAYDPTALLVTMAPPSDLTVTTVSAPVTGIVGQLTSAPLSWTVANIGSNPAVGTWADNIYLSPDGTWNASDPLVGQFFHSGDLAPGSSYTVTTAVGMPGVLPGNYFIIVRTDALDNERDANRSNNQLTSSTTIDITIPTLQLGQTTTTAFGPPYDLYYQFTAQAGQTIDITGNVPSDLTQYEFFIRYGAPPTFDQFDQEYPYSFDTHQQLRIQNAQQGTYYVLFHDLSTASAPTTLEISSKIETFEVDSVSPGLGSNVGSATVTITGAEFTPGAVVSLIGSDGTTRTASQVLWKDSGTLWATFNLTDLATGSYDVSVLDSAQTVTDPNAFTVTDGSAGSLSIHLLVPGSMRYSASTTDFGEAEVVYSNPGDTDASAPLVSLSASTGTRDIVELRLPGQSSFGTSTVQFLALNSMGPAGIIPPRSSFTYTIDFSFTETSLVTSTAVDWSVGEAPTATQIDWPSQSAGLQLPTIPNAAWPAVFANFIASVGPTWGTYVAALANDATYLSQLGTYNETVNQLLSFELEKANAAFTAQSLVNVTADSLPAPGMALTFTQSFQQSIAGRYTQGILGYGWTNNWDIYAITTANGDAAIHNDGVSLFYTLQPDGSYTDEVGDHSTVTLSNGQYQLVTTSGTRYQFNTNGTLNFVDDANGNRITAGYDLEGQLVSLTDSNGESISLIYNTHGLLAQLTDSSGQTETYGYNSTGEFLTSYTDVYGTTAYSYITGESPQRNNALSQITYADNTSMYFTYDSQGRLIDQYRNGGAENESYAYLSPAGYAVTDANNNTSTILFNLYGATSETITPLGIVVSYKYDSNLNLIEVDGPLGTKYTGTYDANGNLTAVTNPLGQTTSFSYDGNNNLTSYTDAKGNTTGYSYNSSNDLLSITYANGTQQQYSYNPLGEATQYLNARGQAVGYTYNPAGLVTQETFPDGTSYSYSYDKLGNLISATDSQNNLTRFFYSNPSNPDLLTKVEYPDGTYLEFSYNIVGQRTQSADQTGFMVNYSYDPVGRLSELTDSSGNLIVRYTYDSAGNLTQKDMGNGTRTVYTYDADGNVLSILNLAPDHATVNSFDDYTYDPLGNVLTDTNQDGEWKYGYDGSRQLVRAIFTPNALDVGGLAKQDIQYVYDAAGNRTSETVNGVVTAYVTNDVNEYTNSTTLGVTTNYLYDADGNLIAQNNVSGITSYTFDVLNQLVGVTGPGMTASYIYNPLGSLVSQTVNGDMTSYQVDPSGMGNVVAAFGKGTLMSHFTYGLGLTSQVGVNGTPEYYDFLSTSARRLASRGRTADTSISIITTRSVRFRRRRDPSRICSSLLASMEPDMQAMA